MMKMMKMMKQIAICFAAGAVLCPSLVFADEDTAKLGIITVTSPGTEQRIEDVQATVEVIDEEKIRSFSGRSLSQILHYATGFFVRDSGSNSRITLRGFNDDHTLILVNGLRRTVKYGNTSADLNGLQLEDIKQIEIVRGPMSALYGSDSLAGVINIVTKKPTDEKSLQTTVVGGIIEREQRDTIIFKGAANLGRYGSTRHRASFEVKKRDEFKEDTDDPFTTLNQEDKLFFSYSGTYDISAYHWLGWNFEYYHEEDEGVSSAGNVPTFENEERYHLDGKYHNETDLGIFDIALGFGRNDAESDRTAGTESTDYKQIELNTFFTRSFLKNHTATFGAGARKQEIEQTIYSKVPDRKVYHILVQDQWRIWDDVTLVAGVRHDDYSDFGDTTNPRATVSWRPGNWFVRIGYGCGFKAPNFAEQYSSFKRASGNRVFDVIGNPDLEPEKSETYEAALGYRTKRFGVEGTYHYSKIDNLISAEVTDVKVSHGHVFNFVSEYMNVNKAKIDGIELTFNAKPWDFWELFASWEYLHKVDDETGERLQDYAQNKVKLGSTLYFGKTKFHTYYRKIIDFYAPAPSRELVKTTYTQVDVRLSYELFKTHELFCGIDNLFDEKSSSNWTRGGSVIDPGARYYYVGYSAEF